MSRPQNEPDYLTSVGTSERMLHSALLERHEQHDAVLEDIGECIVRIGSELYAVNHRLDAAKTAWGSQVKQLESTRLWRFLRWLRLL
jgi:hypothetical protein